MRRGSGPRLRQPHGTCDKSSGASYEDDGRADGSRLVTNEKGNAFPRPIRIHLWYPASRAARPMLFGRYADLASDDVWPKQIVGDMRDALTFSQASR